MKMIKSRTFISC